jgi:PAS domain S-box-containing protein
VPHFLDDDRFHHLVDAAVDYAIFLLDETGHIRTWSVGAERLNGYTATEIIGQHFSAFYAAEERARGRPNQILDIVRRAGRYEEEGYRYRKDGSRFWANVVLTPLRDEAGAIRGFANVSRDVNERRAAAEALRQSEERFRMLVEGVRDYAIYLLDPQGIVTTWNAGAERMKGYTGKEIIGRSFKLFFPATDTANGKPDRELEAARGAGRFEEEGWRVRKDGSRFWANVVLTVLRNSDGEILGFAKVTRDLTQQREAQEVERALLREQAARIASEAAHRKLLASEEAAHLAAQRAEETSRAKDEFLATVSHELRNPLNAIIGWSHLLLQKAEAPAPRKALETIHRNALAQARLIDDVLDVSRIVTGKLRIELKLFDIINVLGEAIEVVRPAADAKRIEIDVDVDSELAPLFADPDRIRQVIWNLLSNAVKFSHPEGQISVRVREAQSALELSVQDTGIGIASEFLPFVFERFRQAESSTNRRFGGLGLGLSIVRHIVELHGGRVAAKSEGLGRGATFLVSLPVRAVAQQAGRDAQSSTRGALPEPQPLLAGSPKILVVDDQVDACELLAELLDRSGASVQTAMSAAEALAFVDRGPPDLVITDIGMPIEDGYAFIQQLRARPKEKGGAIPVIALTAFTRPEDRARTAATGFNRHISKPIEARELIAAIISLTTSAHSSAT